MKIGAIQVRSKFFTKSGCIDGSVNFSQHYKKNQIILNWSKIDEQ